MSKVVDLKTYHLGRALQLGLPAWQAKFQDADPEAINKDRGPEVVAGFYCWGNRAGKPVAPTATMRAPGQARKSAYAGAEI